MNVGLTNMFRPAREEALGENIKLLYGEVSDLYYPPSIIWVIISRWMRYVYKRRRIMELRTRLGL